MNGYYPHFYKPTGWKKWESLMYAVALLWDGFVRLFTLGKLATNWHARLLTSHLIRASKGWRTKV